MIQLDEESLICDLAETYKIYDYRQLPPTTVAVFSYGLKPNSRIKMKMSNLELPIETLLLARIADNLSTLVWFQTKDGQKGKDRPVSLFDLLSGNAQKTNSDDIVKFTTGEDFTKMRNTLIKGGG